MPLAQLRATPEVGHFDLKGDKNVDVYYQWKLYFWGIKGMLAKPSDREAAVRPLIESVGGKLISYYVTTGAHDFQVTVEGDDSVAVMAALMAASAGGGVSNLQTVQAFTPAEFVEAQKKAGALTNSFKSAGQ